MLNGDRVVIVFRIIMTIFTAIALLSLVTSFPKDGYQKRSEVIVSWMLMTYFVLNIFAIWN